MFLSFEGFNLRLRIYAAALINKLYGLLLSFGALSTVLRTTLETVCYTCGIQCTTNDVITYTREVFYTTTAYQYD